MRRLRVPRRTFVVAIAAAVGAASPLAGPSPASANPVAIDQSPPELVGGPWLNTGRAGGLKLASRRNKVTILHFWTFG